MAAPAILSLALLIMLVFVAIEVSFATEYVQLSGSAVDAVATMRLPIRLFDDFAEFLSRGNPIKDLPD